MPSTYKAFGSVVHQAQLEALLVLESFRQSVAEAVGGKHALPALLELAENALEERNPRSGTDLGLQPSAGGLIKSCVVQTREQNQPLKRRRCRRPPDRSDLRGASDSS